MPNQPTTILVVDDKEGTRYTVTRLLQRERYVVREAATGEEALRLAATRPDLIILDIKLPDLNGFEVCRRLRADPATAAIPVLHLSATFADSDSRSQGLEGGADGYLTYPVEPRELIASVEALLRVRRAERAAREQGELLRVTLASIGDAVIATDPEGRVTFLNPVAEALTGWGAEEAIRAPVHQVFHVLNEETRQRVENPSARAIRESTAVGLANHSVLVARDGTERPIDDSAAPIRDADGKVVGAVMVFRDVTERRRADQALRASEARFRRLVETADEGVWEIDVEGHTTYANRRLAVILGYAAPEDLLGRDAFDFVHPEDLAKAREHWGRRLQGVSEATEWRLRRGGRLARVGERVGRPRPRRSRDRDWGRRFGDRHHSAQASGNCTA